MQIEVLQKILRDYGLKPAHSLGQNFLLDDEVLEAAIMAGKIRSGSAVLEIGPGVGTLTAKLLAAGAKVLAVEKDEKFRQLLTRLGKKRDLKVLYQDALKVNWAKELEQYFSDKPVTVVANIPYYITGKIIQQLLGVAQIHSMTLLVQKEVAENMSAKPGKLNLLGLSVQLKAEVEVISQVPASAFYPKPKVDSCLVYVEKFPKPKFQFDEKALFRVAKAAFSGKRKQIHNTLKNNLHLATEEVEKMLAAAGVPPTARPQDLAIDQWVAMSKTLSGHIA